MPIPGALLAFELLKTGLCIGSSLDDFDYARGLISTDVMTNDNVRSLEFVVCQKLSLWQA